MPRDSRASENQLRSMAHERIVDGRLPVMLPPTLNAGWGSGAVCRLCEQPVQPGHVEYAVTDARDGHELPFHFLCYAAWQFECRKYTPSRHPVTV
jgi:hypothetical protein